MDKAKELNEIMKLGREYKESVDRNALQMQLAVLDHKNACSCANKKAEEELRLRIHTLMDQALDLMWQAQATARRFNELTGN